MPLDLVLANARLAGSGTLLDIGLAGGRIAALEPGLRAEAPREDLGGRFVCGGLVETHIHLDKACILDRCLICEGTLPEAVRETAKAKAGFTPQDVYARASRVAEAAVLQGTTRLRSFVEIDPRAGFRSFEALLQVKRDYAWALEIELCAFAQEGTTQEPETLAMIGEALAAGADSLGGCPYTDAEPQRHVRDLFALAERHAVRLDFHIDFDLRPTDSALPWVLAETRRRGFQGRVSVGHATKLSALAPDAMKVLASELAEAGIGVAVLPATDLFLLGREHDRLVPRGVAPAMALARNGVTTSIASNNILNPFTPFGDASLLRMANLFANVAQLARDEEIAAVFGMVTDRAARLLGQDYGLAVGGAADLVVFDAPDALAAVREVRPALAGWRRGSKVFTRPLGQLHRPPA